MANLIRLKQIESGSALQTSAEVGADFSQSVINIVTDNVSAVLPDGVISSSVQVLLVSASGYDQLATDLEVLIVSGAIASTIGSISTITSGLLTTQSFQEYTASLGNTFATDQEVYLTASNLDIDMGEF